LQGEFCPSCPPSVSYHLIRLTLGLMGLDELHLRVLATSSGDIRQRKDAETGTLFVLCSYSLAKSVTVLKLMNKGKHWVLVVSESI